MNSTAINLSKQLQSVECSEQPERDKLNYRYGWRFFRVVGWVLSGLWLAGGKKLRKRRGKTFKHMAGECILIDLNYGNSYPAVRVSATSGAVSRTAGCILS